MKVEVVLDRIEDGKATILAESIGKEFVVDLSELPSESSEGDWLQAELVEGRLRVLGINKEKTSEVKEKSKEHLNRIRNKSGGSKFRRN